jgi:photosystem II stability/assembly factor-like uncharacterized protein
MKKIHSFLFILLVITTNQLAAQQAISEAEGMQLKSEYALPFLIPNWQKYSFYDLAKLYPAPTPTKKTARYEPYEKEEGDANNNQLARWHWYWAGRVSETGKFPTALQNHEEWVRYQEQAQRKKQAGGIKSATANWINKTLPAPTGSAGVGRVDRVFPVNSSGTILYVGSPSGGLWYSSNSGATWTVKNESLPMIGVSGIAADPNNPSTVYISTGDGESRQDQPTLGVYKSTDGGSTWNATSLTFAASAQTYISRLIMDANNPLILFAATNNGLQKTIDGGVTWSTVVSGQARDVRINPSNSSIVYCATNAGIWRSTNGGSSFTQLTANGLPQTGFVRISLAVTAANSNVVYALYAKSDYSFMGVYKSSDAGLNWSLKYSGPTKLTGTQGWYALPIGASPIDSNLVFVGGLQVYRSADGGVSWSRKNPTSVHVDDHDLVFSADGSKLFLGCDGGIYQTTGAAATWNNLSNGLINTQQYHLAVTPSTPNILMYGAQDNDINLLSNGTWDGGNINADGFEVAIDPTNTNVLYGESQYGGLSKSTNGGASFNNLSGAISATEQGNWDTPFLMDPSNHNTLSIGYSNIFKTTNAGANWSKITNWTSGQVGYLAYYKPNPNVIYALRGASLFSTIDGGTTWLQKPAAGINGTKNSIIVCPYDSSRIWITVSGYTAGNKIYYSDNGGITFRNFSKSLPNIPVNNAFYQDSTEDGIYVATDIGVWAYDTLIHDWLPFNQGMPPVIVTELELQKSSNTLFCSTYGRGTWYTTPYDFPKHNYDGNSTSGIKKVSNSDLSARLFPNPAKDELHFTGLIGTSNLDKCQIQVYNIQGQLVLEAILHSADPTLSIRNLEKGSYTVILQKENQTKGLTFIKQ